MDVRIVSKILLVVGMGLLCACCSMEKHETYAGKVELKPLKGERYLPEEEFTYPQSLLFADDCLVVEDSRDERGMLAIVNLDGADSTTRACRMGIGPGEFMNIREVRYSPTDSTLSIYDGAMGRVRLYHFDKGNRSLLPENMISEISTYDFKPVPRDILSLSGGFASDVVSGGKMFVRYDADGKMQECFGDYPGDRSGMADSLAFAMGHQVMMAANPLGDRMVVAGRMSDWLAFYHMTPDGMKLEKEYFSFETVPEVSTTVNGNTELVSCEDKPDTRTCFTSLAATDSHVYCFYHGSTAQERADRTAAQVSIMKFTWTGDFVEAYTVGDWVVSIAVSPDEKYMIAIVVEDNDELSLMRYEL